MTNIVSSKRLPPWNLELRKKSPHFFKARSAKGGCQTKNIHAPRWWFFRQMLSCFHDEGSYGFQKGVGG